MVLTKCAMTYPSVWVFHGVLPLRMLDSGVFYDAM